MFEYILILQKSKYLILEEINKVMTKHGVKPETKKETGDNVILKYILDKRDASKLLSITSKHNLEYKMSKI